ncbi:S41 family peptidase [Chitinophaga sp. GCM10012297]|uniref:Tail specific protease domain-containing protein n=1 Tax=Chitinophaga chungangae TaxID=2821488 RepID=A0ABS3YIE4_9BACT|nr:S41 family peptidase [Chitinophaga chungangae]MBO9154455.1 hypothetical protein [Chitinophaga chungangae]
MHKRLTCMVLLLFPAVSSVAQDSLYAPSALREDLQFIRRQLFQVHANPFSQYTKERYVKYFDSLEAGLTAPLTAAAFRQKAAAALLPLEDEHAALSLRKPDAGRKIPNRADSVATNISYRRYGNTGYILARSFGTRGSQDLPVYERCIDSIFTLVKKDGVQRLLIDVSGNDGGASAVGNMLIDRIYGKSYQSYSMNWKRSDEYLAKLTSWGFNDEGYKNAAPGEVLHVSSRTVTSGEPPYRFTGKVMVLIGPRTFSSAIMFATLVQDNKIAPLAGESPADGHPTHFGEMYSVVLPHTGLELRFGVKEWVRPAGRGAVNKLLPDFPCKLPAGGDIAAFIKHLPW